MYNIKESRKKGNFLGLSAQFGTTEKNNWYFLHNKNGLILLIVITAYCTIKLFIVML